MLELISTSYHDFVLKTAIVDKDRVKFYRPAIATNRGIFLGKISYDFEKIHKHATHLALYYKDGPPETKFVGVVGANNIVPMEPT